MRDIVTRNNSTVRVFDSEQQMHTAAAEAIVGSLRSTLQARSGASLVLTGGRTPRPIYSMLASDFRDRIAWPCIDFFWGDERCVPPDDPQSNYGMAWDSLLSKVPVASDRIHRMIGELADVDKAALRYESEITRAMPGPREPSFDLVLLGLGEDGHTASLFPETVWDEERLVVANYVPRLGSRRISMTPRLLNAARAVLFLVCGADKAKSLAAVLEGPQGLFPAQRILPVQGTLTWMIDAAAAGALKRRTDIAG